MKSFRFLLIISVSVTMLTSCLPDPPSGPDLWESLTDESSYSDFVAALERSGYDEELQRGFIYTLFVPPNTAIQSWLTANNFSSLSEVPLQDLQFLIRYHMVLGEFDLGSQTSGYIGMLSPARPDSFGLNLYFNRVGNNVELNAQSIVTSLNIETTNGLINEIDAVMDLPSVYTHLQSNSSYSTFLDAVGRAGLTNTLRNASAYTVLTPTNSAFERFFDEININDLDALTEKEIRTLVKTHILNENLTSTEIINTSNGTYENLEGTDISISSFTQGQVIVENTIGVPVFDVQATNGTIHVLQDVINPF